LKQLGPQASSLLKNLGPQASSLLKKLGPQAASALKGFGKFATNNPELTNQLLATGLAAAAGAAGGSASSGAATGAATQGTQGGLQALLSQIDPQVLQNLINSSYAQNRDKKCRECVTIRKKKKSGDTLTEEEKRLEQDVCRACEEFCAALDRNPQLGKLDLCDALKALN
jgi:thiamine kinase-like enzyme